MAAADDAGRALPGASPLGCAGRTDPRRWLAVSDDVIDYQVVRTLQKRVADMQMADRRSRAAQGEQERSSADEQQQAQSIIRQVVAWHMQQRLGAGEELPGAEYDARLRAAIFAAIYGAGE